ncbi:MAG TPA: alpha-ketoglutarate-dependent dioxygenase AlkB [Candidatus Limnocylindrales bacterium]|nr:alpha-ketoglutarate-dependent dioxygenase AlkB [Candidatus Limnocylindrales bacterium]
MVTAFQGSLLDLGDDIRPTPLGDTVKRTELAHGAWVDVRPSWMIGADALFLRLHESVPWRAERRQMYERVVDVPRLVGFYEEGATLPHPSLDAAKAMLDMHYEHELGERFATAGLCLYRDGKDSVAWHGDRIGRGNTDDTMVAILSVGAPRAFLLRPRSGGDGGGSRVAGRRPDISDSPLSAESLRFEVGHGDLLVMGGSCQRTWDHAVPKSARATGPRISIQFRTSGVR